METHHFVVKPPDGSEGMVAAWTRTFREVWEFRELLSYLAWRDIRVRYQQTAIGVLWSVLQPLLMVAVFTVILGRLSGLQTQGTPYPLFCLAGILPWQLFSHALLTSSTSLVANQDLVRRVYFPRMLIPIASLSVGLLNFLIGLVALAVLMACYGIVPDARICFAPCFLLLALAACCGAGCYFGAVNVQYRDVQLIMPFLTQFWLFATPVFYPSSLVPTQFRLLYALNPMVAVTEGFRWSLLGAAQADGGMLLISAAAAPWPSWHLVYAASA